MERVQATGYGSPLPDGPAPPVVLLGGGAGDYIAESGTAVPEPPLGIASRPLFVHEDCVLHLEFPSVNFTIRLCSDRTVRILDEHPAAGWTITCADTGELPGTSARTDARVTSSTPQDRGGDGRLSALTNREMQVATLVGECLTNRAIARQLSVAEKTVEMHLSNIFGKLAVSSRTELAALMIRTQRA